MTVIPCQVCSKSFSSYLNLARHMVQTDRPVGTRPAGEHILLLEEIMGQSFVDFGWESDKRIAMALKAHYSRR